jgi:opacity protein-like surface antigen
MKKVLLLALTVLAFTIGAQAQSTGDGRLEIYGGYSYLNARGDGLNAPADNDNTLDLNGFNVGGTVWINSSKSFGITGDYTFHTKTEDVSPGLPSVPTFPGLVIVNPMGSPELRTRYNTIMAGPTYRVRTGRISPFAGALLGASRISRTLRNVSFAAPNQIPAFLNSVDETAFAFSVGGGLDVNLTGDGRIAARVVRAEYLFIKSTDNLAIDNQNNIRISAGVVLRF